MADPVIPTPQDKQLVLEDTVTKTATFNGTSLDLGARFAPGGIGRTVSAVVQVTAADFGSGNETYAFALQDSADNSSFNAIGAGKSVSGTGTVVVTGVVRNRYIRLIVTAAGTTPSITYKAWLNPLP